ncbi:MAG: ABC transporter permease [Trueperaceae bacterium]|nr:ABC transporter permease [Trueperaceae bacterium]
MKLLKNPRISLSLIIIVASLVTGIFAPLIAPYDPLKQDFISNLGSPSQEHLLGTDEFGRDVLSRLIFGARVSLRVAFVSVALAMILGTFLGLTGGYLGGWWELIAMRGSDVLLSLPPILLAMAAVAFLGSSLLNLTLIIGVLYTPRFARVVHAAVVREKNQDYIESQRALGAGIPRILLQGILPNILAPIMVQASLSLGFAILLEAGLSFLGLGAPPPHPSWGNMISTARGYMRQAPYLVISPSITIALIVLAFNTLGDGLRDSLDPRLK